MFANRYTDKNIAELLAKLDANKQKMFLNDEKHKTRISQMKDVDAICSAIFTLLDKNYSKCNSFVEYKGYGKEPYQIRVQNDVILMNIIKLFELPFQKFKFNDTITLITPLTVKQGLVDAQLPLAIALKHTIEDGDDLNEILDILPGTNSNDRLYQQELCTKFRNDVE